MGYGIYEDFNNPGRWAGYMVPAECDNPTCSASIHRGMGYLCESHEVYDMHQDEWLILGGCGMYFCMDHRYPLDRDHWLYDPKPDAPEWIWWILAAPSWKQWREENPKRAHEYHERLIESDFRPGKDHLEALFEDMESFSE